MAESDKNEELTPEEEEKLRQKLRREAIKNPGKPTDDKLENILKRANKKK